ncbi:hypothetical protein PENTCL1PPCAC_6159, partial [Pristionchus entomophagus]
SQMLKPLLISLLSVSSITAKRLPDIYWNSSNPRLESCAAVDDLVDIHCPFGKTNEQSIIYRVSKEEYDECRLGEQPKEVGRCTDTNVETKLKIAFRSFQPNPFAMTYRPDNIYYFISTSTGSPDGMANREGGLCTTHALKMKLHVVKRGGACHVHRKHIHHGHRTTSTTTQTTVTRSIPLEIPFRRPSIDERREEWILTPSLPVQKKNREDDALWDHFYQKVDLTPPEPEVRTRGERVALDAKATEYKLGDAYEALGQVLEGQVMFEIHEIGDEPDSLPWRSSGSSMLSSSTTVILLLLVVVLRR